MQRIFHDFCVKPCHLALYWQREGLFEPKHIIWHEIKVSNLKVQFQARLAPLQGTAHYVLPGVGAEDKMVG